MAKQVVRPVFNATIGLFDEITESVEQAIWAISRRNGILGIGSDCTARAEARQKRIDAVTKAEGVMPSDELSLEEWIAADVAKRASESMDAWFKVEAEPKPASTAKSLPGALDVASGGHRFGGWGATE